MTSPVLSPEQKCHFLVLEAEDTLPYPQLSAQACQTLDDGVIYDMYKDYIPFKPRYVLPGYARFLANDSSWLELGGIRDLDDALSLPTIPYHHVPSVTSTLVYLGQLNTLLQPYVRILTQDEIDIRVERFWRYLNRALPDALMHVNISPVDAPVTRAILRVDAGLKQVLPNLTFIYGSQATPDDLLFNVTQNICGCSKSYISNGSENDKILARGQYGVISCCNSLSLVGGRSTLVRLNLKAIAKRSTPVDDFFTRTLPHYRQRQITTIDLRCEFLYEKLHFSENNFPMQEGLVDPKRFVSTFRIYDLAEAVNLLCDRAGQNAHCGKDEFANQPGCCISVYLAEFVENTLMKYGRKQRAMLHAQSGVSSDTGTMPGARLSYSDEPDLVTYLQIVAPHHAFYHAGISDIPMPDEAIKRNSQTLVQLCLRAFKAGMREFTVSMSGNNLVRVTGHMVRLSNLEKHRTEGSRTNTTWPGEEATHNTHILEQQPRMISYEQQMRFSQQADFFLLCRWARQSSGSVSARM